LTARTRSQFKFGFAALSSIHLPRAAAAAFVPPPKNLRAHPRLLLKKDFLRAIRLAAQVQT
jgi:hypothetical protein